MKIEEIYLESRLGALKGESRLTSEALDIEGMSDARMRHLLNHLGQRISTYVEVGCYHGSTLIAAAFQNPHLTAIGIDNFSEEFTAWNTRGLPRDQLESNLARFTPHATFLEADFRETDPASLPEIDCYFYDGAHDPPTQSEGIVHFASRSGKQCLLLVDDWNGAPVRAGTFEGLSRIADRFRVVTSSSLCDTWNNLGVFVLAAVPETSPEETSDSQRELTGR